jgi:hypothetical protein
MLGGSITASLTVKEPEKKNGPHTGEPFYYILKGLNIG